MRRFTRVIGALLLLAGLALGGHTGWDWWRRVSAVGPAQAALDRALEAHWAEGKAAVAPVLPTSPGTPIARLHLPSIGLRLVVVDGDGDTELARGPGRIPGTADLGAPGNVGLAAHRQPGLFWDLDRLRVGDAVVAETRDTWYIYRVGAGLVVDPEDSSVLAEPADPGVAMLTLVTCEPKLSTARRLVRQASLVRRAARIEGRPAELLPNDHQL